MHLSANSFDHATVNSRGWNHFFKGKPPTAYAGAQDFSGMGFFINPFGSFHPFQVTSIVIIPSCGPVGNSQTSSTSSEGLRHPVPAGRITLIDSSFLLYKYMALSEIGYQKITLNLLSHPYYSAGCLEEHPFRRHSEAPKRNRNLHCDVCQGSVVKNHSAKSRQGTAHSSDAMELILPASPCREPRHWPNETVPLWNVDRPTFGGAS